MAIDSETAAMIMRVELSMLPVHQGGPHARDIMIRCPFCGDSKKDARHAHFGIAVKPTARHGKNTFAYRCFLCDKHSGGMSVEVAKKIGIQDEKLLEYLRTINANIKSSFQYSGANIISKRFDYGELKRLDSQELNYKKDYLWKRLGSEEICDNPGKFKLILDLREFFMKNKLTPNMEYGNRVKGMLASLHERSIGFVSFDNTHINFRDVRPNPQRRYTQYQIYPQYSSNNSKSEKRVDTSYAYAIPNNLNIMSSNLKIVMAEGSFDILRVYTDFYKGKSDPSILFASVSSSHGYQPMLKKCLEFGIMFDEVEIFSDADVRLDSYRYDLKPLVPDARFIVHYNQLSKDVGDIRDPVRLSTVTI